MRDSIRTLHEAAARPMTTPAEPEFQPRRDRGRAEADARIRAFNTQLFPHTPRLYVAYALIVANVLVFAIETVAGVSPTKPLVADLVKWGGDFGPLTTHGQWWRLVTCTFVHAGILHLAMNMYVLFSIGPFLERLLGNIPFLVLYLFAGICGSIVSLVHAPSIVSIGASGAIFGLYGALAGFLLRSKGTLPKELLQQLLRTAGAFVIYNVLFGLAVSGLDQAAHAGGLIGGFLGGLLLGHPIDAAGFAGRARRSVMLAAVGALLVAAAILFIPKSVDFVEEMKQFVTFDRTSNERVNALEQQLGKGQLTLPAWGDRVESEVVQPWLADKERLQKLRVDGPMSKFRDRMAQYSDLRARSLREYIKGKRDHDAASAARSTALQAELDTLATNIWKP
jgi:rhomboid protease GluP